MPVELSPWSILRGRRGRWGGGLLSVGCNMEEGPFLPTTEGMRSLDPWWCWVTWGIFWAWAPAGCEGLQSGYGKLTCGPHLPLEGQTGEGWTGQSCWGFGAAHNRFLAGRWPHLSSCHPYSMPFIFFLIAYFSTVTLFSFQMISNVLCPHCWQYVVCLLNCFSLIYLLLGFLTIFIFPLLKSLYVYYLNL